MDSAEHAVDAAAQQAEANFQAVQQFFTSTLPSSSSAADKWEDVPAGTWEDFDKLLFEGAADLPRTWDEISPCSPAEDVVMGTGEQDKGEGIEAEGTDEQDDVSLRLMALIGRWKAAAKPAPAESYSASSSASAQARPSAALKPKAKWGPARSSAPASSSTGDGERVDEQWRARTGNAKGGRYGNRGGRNRQWYTARAEAASRGEAALATFLRLNPKPQ
jgi:hypothetical protein